MISYVLILTFKSGVSEGQYQAVLDLELKPIQEICAETYRKKDFEPPKITIVIVGKRHHTRFYPTSPQHADTKHGHNPLNGTVVDRGITMQKGWDFYLQAHAPLKGTVSLMCNCTRTLLNEGRQNLHIMLSSTMTSD